MRKSVFVVATAGALAFAFAGAVGAPGVAWGSTAQGPPPTIRDSNARFGPGKMWAPGDPPVIRRSLQAPDGTPVIRDSKISGPPDTPTVRDSLQAQADTPIIRDSKISGPPDTPVIRGSNAQFGPGKMWAPGDPPVITLSWTAPGTPGNIEFSARTSDPDDGGQVFAARTGDPCDGGQVFGARTSDPDDGGQVL